MNENVFEVLKEKEKFNRRNFFKTLALIPFLGTLPLDAKEARADSNMVTISMNGDLDDDLIIIKASKTSWNIEACYQMHNPSDNFFLEGRAFPRIHSPGFITYSGTHSLENDEILVVTLSNEREEREPDKKLLDRTHYKSVPLYVDAKEAIPSMIPENNDIDYTTWYDPKTPEGAYNYYRVWENAVVNLLIVVPENGKYRLDLINKDDKISASIEVDITDRKTVNPTFKRTIAGPIQNHPLVEIDGGVFMHKDFRKPNDKRVKELAAYNLMITMPNGIEIISPLPYPFPYINRLFFIAKSNHNDR